jgi:transcriptional regulator
MYVPPAFQDDDIDSIRATIRAARLASLVTATAEGLIATPLPLLLDEAEGALGVLYGHVAKANPHWRSPPNGEALAIFMGPEAYVTPSWYATKQETGKVVPTWNYVAVHAYGPVEFFQETERLLEVVTRLTNIHEASRPQPWTVGDAPADFIASQLRGIVGLRIPVKRFEGKRKMSQNRPEADRIGVAAGLAASEKPQDQEVAPLISLPAGANPS